MFNYGSMIVILLITTYQIIYNSQRSDKLKESAGMTISMAVCLLASAAMGIVSAQTFEHNLKLSLFIAAVFASCIGYFMGKRFSLVVLINSVLAGWLGAMAGSIFGFILFLSNKIVLITDITFVIVMFLLQQVIDRQLGEMSKKTSKKMTGKPKVQKFETIVTLTLSISIITLAFFTFLNKNHLSTAQIGQPQTQYAILDEENDLQEATIDVTASGFSPKTTIFSEGTVMKVIIHVGPNLADGLKLISSDLGIDADLSEGDNLFIINKPNRGTYEFELGSVSFKGLLIVE
nr:cupredoxin domain-containing protein [Bacillus sp. FJAT-29790]